MKFYIIFVVAVVLEGAASADSNEIPPKCPRSNEKYHSCSNGCEYTCASYKVAGPCIGACSEEKAGCYCDLPFVRNKNGDCIPQEQCETQSERRVFEPQQPYCKGPNEVFNPMGNLCPLTCATRGAMIECKEGTQSGCFCAPGFLRNSKNVCVLESQCT